MQILLSPATSAKIWIRSRMVEARANAQRRGCAVDSSTMPIAPLIPASSKLLQRPTASLNQLSLSAAKREVESLQQELGVGAVRLCGKEPSKRHTGASGSWTVLPEALRGQPVYELTEGVYLCAPAVSILGVAKSLSRPAMAQLLTELCGKYALDRAIEWGFGACVPLLDPKGLAQMAGLAKGVRGAACLKAALPYVAAGAESPCETAMQLFMCLPRVDGGAKLPLGEFGHQVVLGVEGRRLCGKKSCRCDLYYPAARLDLEYESDLMHAGEANRKKDARREGALALEKVEVIPVTSQEIGSLTHMNALAALVASRLELTTRVRVKDYPLRQWRLLDDLLARRGWSF